MFCTLRLGKFKSVLALSALMLLLSGIFSMDAPPPARESSAELSPAVLVIDPGHGGVDSGALSVSGIKESDINLAIGLKLMHIADFYGIESIMTRTDDNICTDIKSYSERRELERRTELVNSVPGAVLISIHQNTFPTSQPSGAQVLYAPVSGSRSLGELTQKNILEQLDGENRRVAAPADERLYMCSHVKCPAILVECGFLSNFSDLEKLCSDSYQSSFAAVLAGSYIQYKNSIT